MVFVHFFVNNEKVLTQFVSNVPSLDEKVKIKGKKGTVIKVDEIEKNIVHVHIHHEQVLKKQIVSDSRKKRR